MLGKPKYKIDETVKFKAGEEIFEGKIYIIDVYGTFFRPDEVSYDIMVEDFGGAPCLFKHIIETDIVGV